MSTPAAYLPSALSGYNIYRGATSGNPVAQTRAGLNAVNLYGKLSNNTDFNQGTGGALNALNIYSGLRQGGVGGYGGALVNAAQLGSRLGALSPQVGQYAGYAAVPLSLYNFGKSWKSGATGADALSGAQTGATIGNAFVPGVGALVGGVIGGAAGALSSAFGPGAKDPETYAVQNVIDAVGKNPNQGTAIASSVQNPYLQMAGLMDRHESTLPQYAQYGRMGEQKFTNDMVTQMNNAIKANPALAKDPNAMYNQVIAPWVNKMGSGYSNVGQAYTQTNQGLIQDMVNQYLGGTAAQNWKAVGGDSPFANIYDNSPLSQYATPPASTRRAAIPRAGVGASRVMQAKGGGFVKNPELHGKLRKLYEGSYAGRKTHFDDGGGVDYFTPSYTSMVYESNPWSPSDMDSYALPTDQAGLSSALGETGLSSLGVSPVSETSQASNSLNDSILGPNGSLSGLGSLLGTSSLGSLVKQYGALAPILAAALSKPKTASAPATPAGYGAIPSIATPNNSRSYTQPNVANWYTYGQGPEQSFFSNNQLPYTPGVSPPSAAPGGSSPTQMNTQPVNLQQPLAVMAQGGSFDSTQGDDYVSDPGHGDGTSDAIDAKLSGGEYVMDAGTVAMLGNGSNEAGARALDGLRQRLRQHAGKSLGKGKQFMKAKSPESYLKRGKS